jgi:hypothetical protein
MNAEMSMIGVRPLNLTVLPLSSILMLATPVAAQDSRIGTEAPAFEKSPQTFEPVGAYELFLEDLDADADLDAVISSYGTSLIL